MRSFAFYTVLRFALFVLVALILTQLGASALMATLLGLVISAALSYLLLRRQRDAVALQVAETIERRQARRGPEPGVDERAEDAATEAADASAPAVPQTPRG